MTTLSIEGLTVRVGDQQILRGVDLDVSSGEVHAVMGPNGSGKSTLSHVIMGKPGYEVTAGSITLDGEDLLAMATWERAKAGLFLAMQYPIEVPGVSLLDAMAAAGVADASGRIGAEAERLGIETALLERPLNVDLSGGEKKRNETLQLGVLGARIAVLDELDSGLDVDALRVVSRRIEEATETDSLGVLVITHYSRLLTELRPDRVHVLANGVIQESGGPELATELEQTGYGRWVDEADVGGARGSAIADDPLADPFADPLA